MSSKKVIYVTPRVEEILILSALGAAIGLALASPFASSANGHLTIAGGITAALGAGVGAWLALRQERDSHLKGARYYPDPVEALRVLQRQERARFSAAQKAGQVHGMSVGGLELSRKTETEHLFDVGITGSGKTAGLCAWIDQMIARGDRVVIHDIKGDLAARYFRPETCVMLGPWDARAAIWDAASDIDSPPRADEIAAAVCGVKSAQGPDAHWARSAANVLRGLIKSYMREGRVWTWADLRDALAGDPVALVQRAAAGEPLVRTQFPSAFGDGGGEDGEKGPYVSKEGASILSTLAAKAGWLLAYAAVDAKDKNRERFSIQRWLMGVEHTDKHVVFLNYSALYAGVCEQLFGALVATIKSTVSSPLMPEVDPDSPAIWCVFDEYPQMGAEALVETQVIAELGRSRGVRVVVALQDETQLAAKLGQVQAAPILAQQATRVYLRTSPQTTEQVCKRAGTHQVDRIETTGSNGAVQGKTKHAVEEQVLRPDALTGLHVTPDGVEMILHTGDVLGKLVQPFPERRPSIAPAYVESATWRRGSLPDGPVVPTPNSEPVVDLTFDWKEEE